MNGLIRCWYTYFNRKKFTNQILVGRNMKRPSTAMKSLTQKKLMYAIFSIAVGESQTFLHVSKVDVLLSIYKHQRLRKFCQEYQNDMEGMKLLDGNFSEQHRRPADLQRHTFSSFLISHTHNILHSVSSYYFQI